MEAMEAMDMEASKDSVDTDIRDVCWRQNERGIENKKGIKGWMERRQLLIILYSFCLFAFTLYSNGFDFLECSGLFFTPYGVSRMCGRRERRW